MKTEEGRKLNKENKERKHKAQKAAKSAKRAKTAEDGDGSVEGLATNGGNGGVEGAEDDAMNVGNNVGEEDEPEPKAPSTMNKSNNTTSQNLTNTPLDLELAKAYEVTTMSILSSSQIQQKVTRSLALLSVYPAVPPSKPAVMMLHTKSKAATKMISIAEIIKREIAGKGGKWFQYNRVERIMEEQQQKKATKENSNGNGMAKDIENVDESMAVGEEGGAESDEEAFETMKTPFERAIEGKANVRAVPVMTIYLSRVQIESLRKEYGEQTNGLEIPHL